MEEGFSNQIFMFLLFNRHHRKQVVNLGQTFFAGTLVLLRETHFYLYLKPSIVPRYDSNKLGQTFFAGTLVLLRETHFYLYLKPRPARILELLDPSSRSGLVRPLLSNQSDGVSSESKDSKQNYNNHRSDYTLGSKNSSL